jgi:succinate dehydrogenase/fumarate reductase-like Fe-S protein
MTHKLSSWQEQFGVSGCVGCGRCITWCPMGIDLTQEAAAFQAAAAKASEAGNGRGRQEDGA